MRILVVGGGGREHALCWRLLKSGHEVVCAPGNPGIAEIAECIAISGTDVAALVQAAVQRKVDLVVVGPEAPLVLGLADELRRVGLPVFGPGRDGAQLEGSKVFSKQFFARNAIRTAEFRCATTVAEAHAAIDDLAGALVVKADGLAAGKGVIVCKSVDEAKQAAAEILSGRFGAAGASIVIERRIRGRELSIMGVSDGKRVVQMAPAEDHKTLFDGDEGPNTGGMGAVCPARWASHELLQRIQREILEPTVSGLIREGIDYRGVLYAGIMVDDQGSPWLLEYNCRFGDPETQPIMLRFSGDLGAWLLGAAHGDLPQGDPPFAEETAVCVILTSAGYPESPRSGDVITGVAAASHTPNAVVFHAGTARVDANLVTAGGRVIAACATGVDLEDARSAAYTAAGHVHFAGKHFRSDIGKRGETR